MYLTDKELDSGIILFNPSSINTIKPGDTVVNGTISEDEKFGIPTSEDFIEIEKLNVVEADKEEDEDHLYVKGCDAASYYGDPSKEGEFLKKNLFSELTTDYERAIARRNLGIAEAYAMLWGNITGNLLNQEDLVKFVQENSTQSFNQLIDEINLKLSQWAYEINHEIERKADITSPDFKGTPTTTNPIITDDSRRIPTTSWVNSVVDNALGGTNLKSIKLSPEYIYLGEPATDVTVTWEYEEEVESQTINGIEINSNVRSYTFKNVSETFYIRLRYVHGGVTYARAVSFNVICPLYYGNSSNYNKCERSPDYRINANAGDNQYIYIFVPDGKKAILSVNGIHGGFKPLGYLEINGYIYTIFKSDQVGLGETVIDVINQDYTIGQIKYLT